MVDDSTISSDTLLWRAIDPNQPNAVTYDSTLGKDVPSIGTLRTHEMSVQISGRPTLDDIKAQYPGWRIAQFTAGAARDEGYIVVRDPADPNHGLLYDKDSPGKRPSKGKVWRLIKKIDMVA
jgi:hypothetical protein